MTALSLPLADLDPLRRRVAALTENRPGVYRLLDAAGRCLYVGKAKRLRQRLLSYFRLAHTDQKAGRIIRATADLEWEYHPSEFAACLAELRHIRRLRPPFNFHMNRTRRLALVRVSPGPVPKLVIAQRVSEEPATYYGPFTSPRRLAEAIRVLNDLLGLRDCALNFPMHLAEQTDLFAPPARAGCPRFELGTCSGPCAGKVTREDYHRRLAVAVAFLEGRGIAPLDRVVAEMTALAEARQFERALRWRERFEALEWLLAATSQARSAIEALSFVYTDPGVHGDARCYVIRRATVRTSAPEPQTPIEREAFSALVRQHTRPEPAEPALHPDRVEETLLVLSWFRRHPAALRRTTPFERWL